MQFHEYATMRNTMLRKGMPPWRERARAMKTHEFRQFILESLSAKWKGNLQEREPGGQLNPLERSWYRIADMEQMWVDLERPYYKFWPIAISMAQTVRLDIPMRSIELPFQTLLLQFPQGHEPYSIGTAMLHWDQGNRLLAMHCSFANSSQGLELVFNQYEPEQTFEVWLQYELSKGLLVDEWDEKREETCDAAEACGLIVRLAVFVALLSRGEDMITPLVLSKDQQKHDSTDDPDVKKWLEDRAARRAGRGFDVGKKLQLEKENSPHWRNPHLALFWTGTGRTKPIIKMRSGSVVQRVSMAEVPTGYLGPETEEEDTIPNEKTPRESFAKSHRFAILKRDEYKCQLCGRSQKDDGVKLHIDHRVPLAKGGSNEDENLWTLCEDCNLGKSDRSLHE